MSDEALTAAVPGRPEYTVKKYIQLVEALRYKAAALTSSSGQRSNKAAATIVLTFVWPVTELQTGLVKIPGSNSRMQLTSSVCAPVGILLVQLEFCWFKSSMRSE